jgi:hypothetical protein
MLYYDSSTKNGRTAHLFQPSNNLACELAYCVRECHVAGSCLDSRPSHGYDAMQLSWLYK